MAKQAVCYFCGAFSWDHKERYFFVARGGGCICMECVDVIVSIVNDMVHDYYWGA